MKGQRALTLIELLVVIALLTILAALAFTAVGRARGKTYSVYCSNNLRQWGGGLHLYLSDNRDYLPPEGWANPPITPTASVHTNSWYVLLPRQMGMPWYYGASWRTNREEDPGRSLWICPSNPRRSTGTNLFHYCLNGVLDGTGSGDRQVKTISFRSPSSIVYLFDTKNLPAVQTHVTTPGNFVHTNLHNGGANFLFVDGHVARFRNADYWDFEADRGRTDHPELVWTPK